jgi:glycosyltransferase involved in cell wall biosynthesis
VHIVLDLQACQSPEGRRRGIGRYSLALAKAMCAQSHEHDISILLSSAMGDAIEFLRGQFDSLLPQERIYTWHSLSPTASVDPANAFRRQSSELLRLEVLRQLNPDIVHVASLFDGWGDEVVATVPLDESFLGAVTLYDLIPLVHEETYLADPSVRRWYLEKIQNLRRADLLLGISQFSCREASELLQIPADRLTNISGAADDIFVELEDAEMFRQELMHRYGVQKKFVMYAGGFDARKNIGALIRSFAMLPSTVRSEHQLVIVGGAPPPEKQALISLASKAGLSLGEVVFTGYVPDVDLVKLYNLCALYVFPSLQEGFGLPALEAMASGAIVIGSDASSLPEVIGNSDALFDPRNESALSHKMLDCLTDEGLRSSLRDHNKHQRRKFSWSESARRVVEAFERASEYKASKRPIGLSRAPDRRQKTAFLPAPHSLLAPGQFGVPVIYADKDCAGLSAKRGLNQFPSDLDSFDRIVIELADEPYCAKTIKFIDNGATDVVFRDVSLGRPLAAMGASVEGREYVTSLAYLSGGYPAVKKVVDGGFNQEVLGSLIGADSFALLERSDKLSGQSPDVVANVNLTWRSRVRGFASAVVELEGATTASEQDWQDISKAFAANETAAHFVSPQWLVDISNLFVNDAGTGIQRVVRHVLDELIATPPAGFRVEPIFLSDDGKFRYARSYCQKRYFKGEILPADEPVAFARGDVYLGLDLIAHLLPEHIDAFRHMRNIGIKQHFVVYDLLPLVRPDCFDPNGLRMLRRWYESVVEVADSVMCISRAVADEFESWLHQARPERMRPLNIGWFHLGADLAVSGEPPAPELSLKETLTALGDKPTFLMVGTIEPRKGHAQTLAAFDRLWSEKIEVNLVLIGKPGWLVDALLQRLREHPQRAKRLFWFEKAGDGLLLALYRRASALLMASEGEGFGLPLIEAAHHGLPLIVRDLPVFREIAGEHALYFSGFDAVILSQTIIKWLGLNAEGAAPQSDGVEWKSWTDATAQLVNVVVKEEWVHQWSPGSIHRYGAFDYRFATQIGRLLHGRMTTCGAPGLLIYGPYVALSAGQYSVKAYGGGVGTAWMDVCSSQGKIIHCHCEFAFGDLEMEVLLAELDLALPADVHDLEVRVGVYEKTDMWLGRIEIHPVLGMPLSRSGCAAKLRCKGEK